MADTETPADPAAEAPAPQDPPRDPQELAPADQQADPGNPKPGDVEGNLADLTQDPPTVEPAPSELFDPSASNIGDVQAALDAADGREFARIKAAEREGKARKGVLEYTQNPANVEPDPDGYTRVIVDA